MAEIPRENHEGYASTQNYPEQSNISSDYDGKPTGYYDEPSEMRTPYAKSVFGIIFIIGISFCLVIGFTNDLRYLVVIGLVLAIMLVLSIMASFLRKSHHTFWDAIILRDLFEILFYLIGGLIRVIIAIAAKSD